MPNVFSRKTAKQAGQNKERRAKAGNGGDGKTGTRQAPAARGAHGPTVKREGGQQATAMCEARVTCGGKPPTGSSGRMGSRGHPATAVRHDVGEGRSGRQAQGAAATVGRPGDT
jgi:hypothetical protein